MKTREQNRNNKRTEVERFTERIQTRVAGFWLKKLLESVGLELSAWWVLYFKLCQLFQSGRESRAQPYEINALVVAYGYQSQCTTNRFFQISCCVSSLEWSSTDSFKSCNLKCKDRIKLKNLVESSGFWFLCSSSFSLILLNTEKPAWCGLRPKADHTD